MLKISKILNIATIVMFVITLVLLGLFFFGGDLPNTQYTTPVFTGELLWWAYILLIICAIASLIFPIIRLFTRPKEALKSLIALVGLVVIVLIAYAMSDGTIMDIPGYDGPDNVPSRLKFADTMIYMMYILGIGTVLTIIVTEIMRKFR